MKNLIIIFLFLFNLQSWTKADDIGDFEIAEMSVGDSLLIYMNIDEIKKAEENSTIYPDSNYIVIFYNQSSELYEYIQIVYDQKDKNYIIHGLTGAVDYPDQYEECKKSKIDIIDEFKIVFKDAEMFEDEGPHAFAPDSKVAQFDFYPKSGGFARVSCTDWSEKMFEENGWVDNLKISLGSEKFVQFLSK